ncbi:hypothetical protein OAF28_01060 [Akkermansiaceae bacterium]|nr:hypothetical protein [Akkermansiaceae bacterium]
MECLIVGFGNIAKIHAKYLDKKGVNWYWYDVNKDVGPKGRYKDIKTCRSVDRVIVCTPENNHLESYNAIRGSGYEGYILIEKPLGLNTYELEVLSSDKKVISGMVERFNPTVTTLKSILDNKKIVNIDFNRCCSSLNSSPAGVMKDIAIHDIDLLYFLEPRALDSEFFCLNSGKTFACTFKQPLCRMIWSKDTFFKERKIIVRQENCTYEADLQDQSIIKHWSIDNEHVSKSIFVEKGSPIENEHNNFFSKDPVYINSEKSHKILFQMGV